MLFNNQETVHGHTYATDPLEWLTLRRGVAYWVSADSNAQVHLVGNIAVWAAASASLLVYSALAGLYLLRRRRGCYDIPDGECRVDSSDFAGGKWTGRLDRRPVGEIRTGGWPTRWNLSACEA